MRKSETDPTANLTPHLTGRRLIAMSIAGHHRPRIVAIAFVTLLAVVVAPLCSPLCAARHCASGKATASRSEESCHHEAASIGGSASSSHFTSSRICYSSELPPAVLNANNELAEHLEQSVASHSTVAVTHAAEILTLSVFAAAELPYQDGSAKPPLSTLSHTAVLRI